MLHPPEKTPELFERYLPYALALPIVLYEIVLIVYPIMQGIYGSFQQIELAASSPPTWAIASMMSTPGMIGWPG